MGAHQETVGERIARLRRHKGLKQSELAQRAGLHPSSLNQIEKGKRVPTTATISRLAGELGTTRDVVLDGETTPRPADGSREPDTVSPAMLAAIKRAIYEILQDATIAIGISLAERTTANAGGKNRPHPGTYAGSDRAR